MYKNNWYRAILLLVMITNGAHAAIWSKWRHSVANHTKYPVHVSIYFDVSTCSPEHFTLQAYDNSHPNHEPVWGHTTDDAGCNITHIEAVVQSSPPVNATPFMMANHPSSVFKGQPIWDDLYGSDGTWSVREKANKDGYEVVLVSHDKYQFDA